jgi:hypothetical protein
MTRPKRVFLAGEGTNDIGSFAMSPERHDLKEAGVVGALLRKIRQSGWEIVGGIPWKHLHKVRAKGASRGEESNVMAAALRATDPDVDADVLVFVRDTDGDSERQEAIEQGLARAEATFSLKIVGGVVDFVLETWILALKGETATEGARKGEVEQRAKAAGFGDKNGFAMIAIVDAADLDAVPSDAMQLLSWITDVGSALR